MPAIESPAPPPESEWDATFDALRRQVATLPQTAGMMFLLGDEGHRSLFEQVVASIVSVRTYEEVTLPACRRLFERATTPAAVLALGEAGGERPDPPRHVPRGKGETDR